MTRLAGLVVGRAASRELSPRRSVFPRRDRAHAPLPSARRPLQRAALEGKERGVAAFLPCCGRAELPPAAARPAQELPFGRSSGDPPSQHRGGAPNSCERARGQAPLSGASKTSKISCCTGWGDGSSTPALEAVHMYLAEAAPLCSRLWACPRAAESASGQPAGGRGRDQAGWRAAGWNWHSWAAGSCVGWPGAHKGSLKHLRTLTPADGSCSACQMGALEG